VLIGPFRGILPIWTEPIFEVVAVVSLFVLICLAESGGNDPGPVKTAS
jgi:hypothetical protein